MRNRAYIIVAVLFLVAFVTTFNYGGCGGGGSSGSSAPAAPAPAQVTTPSPANLATNVTVTQQLSWAAASGATSYDVYLGLTTTGWSPITTSITALNYTSPTALASSTPYYWRIDSKNTAGTTQGLVWSFTTQEGWGTASLIETDNLGNAFNPQICFDPSGNAGAVWSQFDGTRDNIWANRYVAGTGWATAALIETDTGGAFNSQIAFDPSGNAMAVWQQLEGTRYNIRANRYVSGTGWATAALIETDNLGDATNPQIAFDQSGHALAVWYQSDGIRNNIWANRYVSGTGWATAALIETDTGSAFSPQIAFDPSGNAIAVWSQFDGIRDNIWANRYVAVTGWAGPGLIETDNTGNAQFPQIALDPSGNALAVWYQSDGTRYNIWANRYVSGTVWATAGLIETDNIGDATNPQIAFDPSGNAMAVWYQSDGIRNNIWANRYVSGTGWAAAGLIETDNLGNAYLPQIAFDPSGHALAVWFQSDGTLNNIWANRYVLGTGWATAGLIETDNLGNAQYPQIAFDASGNAIAVWYQADGTLNNIWANSFR